MIALLSATCLFSNVVTDTIRPVITIEASDLSVTCSNASDVAFTNWFNSAGGAMATDNSGNVNLIPNISLQDALDTLQVNQGYTCGLESFVTVTWIAVDDCNNQSSTNTIATFNTQDNAGPVFIVSPISVSVECNEMTQDSLNNWITNFASAVAGDSCSEPDSVEFFRFIATDNFGVSVIGDFDNPIDVPLNPFFCYEFVNVSFWVRDQCNNQTIESAQFTITDNEDPVWSAPIMDISVSCEETAAENIIGIDNCGGELNPVITDSSSQGSDPDLCNFYNYIIERTWMVSDPCGNAIQQIQTIVVADTTAPSFDLESNVSIDCTEIFASEAVYGPTNIQDNCSETNKMFSDTMVGDGCQFTIERVWAVTDICGNSTTALQIIEVTDSTPPVILNSAIDTFVSCDQLDQLSIVLTDWISNNADAQVVESCGVLESFQASPGTYDLNDPSTFPGQLNTDLISNNCNNDNGFLSSVSVDFVFHDGCGNAVVSNASFGISDFQEPQIFDCPMDTIIGSSGANCEGVFSMPLLNVLDNCSFTESPLEFEVTNQISSSDPGNQTVAVDSVLFSFGPLNLNSNPAIGSISLDLSLFNMDSGENTEFFIIKGEDGSIIDSTNIFTECGDDQFTTTNISISQINDWAADGFIELWLVPNVPDSGVFSINDICGGSSVQMNLTFDIDLQNTITTAYSVNFQDTIFVDQIDFPIDLVLPSGVHTLQYLFIDCGGNTATCFQNITVEDDVDPTIICPADTLIDLELDQCQLEYELSLDFDVIDNCGLPFLFDQQLPENPSDAFLNFDFDSTQDTLLADDVFFTFVNVNPVLSSGSEIELLIELNGDIDDPGESFEIYGEGGFLLGTTAPSSYSGCGSSLTSFILEPNQFNDWASDNELSFTAVSPNNSSISGGGINNCNDIVVGDNTDGISTIRARLSYTDATVSYNVSGVTSVPNTILYPNDTTETVILNGGINVIEYVATDAFGNTASCTYQVSVLDEQDPEIECTDLVLFVHPSGLVDTVLDPHEILIDSSDNCGIIEYSLSQELFNCSEAGTIVDVTVTAIDAQGNQDVCFSQVRVETSVLTPDYTAGICLGDTLRLFANVPPVSVPNAYTFSWTGPDGFISNLENPIIPNPDANNNGTYVLTVTGFNQCESMGTIEVAIQQLTTPELSTSDLVYCEGAEVILQSTNYGTTVDYLWYEGLAPNGILLQTTSISTLSIFPSLGNHDYYVEVSSPDCATLPSNTVSLELVEIPNSSVQEAFITICEGEDIVLGSLVFDPDYEYKWTGPNGYVGNGQFPTAITDATQLNQGLYNLIICNASCASDTAISQVVVFDAPETPIITGEDILCEGSSFVLSVNNVTNADQYLWYLDNVLFATEGDNNLVNIAQESLSGDWTVVIEDGLCQSDTSEVFSVFIEEEFQIGTSNSSNNGFVCDGDSVTLNATFIPDAQYIWESPSGEMFPGQSITVEAVAGTYTVSVTTQSGCEIDGSSTVFIDEIPQITALSNNSEACMDGTQPVQFFPTVVPAGNYTYEWMGPLGFAPTNPNPFIPNANSTHNGVYTLVVTNGECTSDPEITVVDITDIPTQPELISELIFCQGDTLIIETAEVLDAQYLWSTPLGDFETSEPLLLVEDAQNNSEGIYQLVIMVNGCESIPSEPLELNIQAQPAVPNLLSNSPVCEGDTLFFNAAFVMDANYEWDGPGFTSNQQNPFIANASTDQIGQYRVRVFVNGCPSEWNSLDVSILERPATPELSQTEYFACESGGSDLELCILSDSPEGTIHNFYLNGILIESSEDLCILLNNNLIDPNGPNLITVQSDLSACLSAFSAASNINIDNVPSILAEAQEDLIIVCDENFTSVSSVFGPPDVEIQWSSDNDDIIISAINEQNTEVSNLSEGLNQIILTYSIGACLAYSTDTVDVINLLDPVALNDTLVLNIQLAEAINVLNNDQYNVAATIQVVSEPDGGSYLLQNGLLTYTPDALFPGIQTLQYEICYEDCPDLCDIATVVFDVQSSVDCQVPNIITPNGDNINDALIISCLATGAYPQNELKIFNQWGDQIFEEGPYQNDWKGTYNNVELPVGTYFYILDRGDGSKPLNGFIHIEK